MKNLSVWDGSQKDQNLCSWEWQRCFFLSPLHHLFFSVKGFCSPFSYQADLSIEENRHIFDTYNQDINMYTLARLALLKALSFDGLEDAHFLV